MRPRLVPAGGNCCDFCNESPVYKLIPCRNFEVRGTAAFTKETGVWAACWACCQFVDAAKWAALTERAFQKYVQKHGVPRHNALRLRPQFEDMVRKFAEHKLSEC
jgi:hypothetical protein